MVSNPLGDVAPKGVAPPNLMPRHEVQPHAQGLPGPMGGQPESTVMGSVLPHMPGPPGPHGMEPPQHMQGPPLQGPPTGLPGPGMQQQYMGVATDQPAMGQPPYQPPKQAYMPPLQQQPAPFVAPPEGVSAAAYGLPVQPPAQPVDPRRTAAPRPMMSLASQPPPQAPVQPHLPQAGLQPPQGPSGSALTPEQQQGERVAHTRLCAECQSQPLTNALLASPFLPLLSCPCVRSITPAGDVLNRTANRAAAAAAEGTGLGASAAAGPALTCRGNAAVCMDGMCCNQHMLQSGPACLATRRSCDTSSCAAAFGLHHDDVVGGHRPAAQHLWLPGDMPRHKAIGQSQLAGPTDSHTQRYLHELSRWNC